MAAAVILFSYAGIYSYQEEYGIQMAGCIRNSYGTCSGCDLCRELLGVDHTCVHSCESSNDWYCRDSGPSRFRIVAGGQAGLLYMIEVMLK